MAFVAVLLVLGASGLVGQILLLRELLIVSSGNELSIGIILGNWLVLEALGCWWAGRAWARRQDAGAAFAVLQAVFAAALPAAVYAARLLRDLSGVAPGEGLGIGTMTVASLPILALVSSPHGALFALAGRMRESRRPGSEAGGFVYGWETAGTLAGGLLLTFLLLPRLGVFRIALGVSALDLLVCLAILWRRRARRWAALCGAAALAAGVLALGPGAQRLHESSVRRQWPGQEVAFYENSVYGNVTVLRAGGQSVFLTDGMPAVTVPVPDVQAVEELAHFPLLAHPAPREVLVLGGGAGGLLLEVLKHPVERVDYAELNPLLLEALSRFPAPLTEAEFNDPRLRVHGADGRLLVKTSRRLYDAIILGAARPSNLQTNRLYTREFFAEARARLKPGGVLAFSLPGSTSFMGRNLARLNACLIETAEHVFARVRPLAGERNIFLATDREAAARLDGRVLAQRLKERGIQTSFLTAGTMAQRLEPQWADMLREFLAEVRPGAGVNRDFSPRAVLYDLADWNAMFSPAAARLFGWAEALSLPRLAVLLVLAAAALLVWHVRVRSLARAVVPAAMAATGFAGMVFSMGLTFAFQALYGYVYLWIGLLVSVFMAGAAAGSLAMARRDYPARRAFLAMELALAAFSLLLPAAFTMLAHAPVSGALLQSVFLLLALVSGALTGAQFPPACRLSGGDPAWLYTCDLLGGWLGGILGGALLLPVLGLRSAFLFAALLKLASLVVCSTATREKS